MDIYDETEQAFINGYSAGYGAGRRSLGEPKLNAEDLLHNFENAHPVWFWILLRLAVCIGFTICCVAAFFVFAFFVGFFVEMANGSLACVLYIILAPIFASIAFMCGNLVVKLFDYL